VITVFFRKAGVGRTGGSFGLCGYFAMEIRNKDRKYGRCEGIKLVWRIKRNKGGKRSQRFVEE
jgi:hypothetical protein